MTDTNKTVAVFQSWYNGGLQISKLYTTDVDQFISDSKGSFADLHRFDNIDVAIKCYNDYFNLCYP